MCSIMGYCGSNADLDIFKKGFDWTITRVSRTTAVS